MTDRLTGLCSRVVPRQGCLRRNEASRRLTPLAANLTASSSRRRSWPITFRRVVFNLFTRVYYYRCWSNSMLRVRPAKIVIKCVCYLRERPNEKRNTQIEYIYIYIMKINQDEYIAAKFWQVLISRENEMLGFPSLETRFHSDGHCRWECLK